MNLVFKGKRTLFVVLILMIGNISIAQASITYNVEAVFNEPMKLGGGTVGDTLFSGQFEWDSTTDTLSSFMGVMNSSMVSMVQDISLTYNLDTAVVGNIVTASVFKDNTTDVFDGGGYVKGDFRTNGAENAYFSFSFDKNTMMGDVDSIVYADCTATGMMGTACMTGHSLGGTMMARPSSLTISAVPVPAAVWLFGSALLGMLGVSRKRTLSV